MGNILLLSGGTGVGTSTLALELAKILDVPSVISTDAIREVIRVSINPHLYPALLTSTYLAGQTENYKNKSVDVQQAEILRGFKNQATAVSAGIEAIVQRVLEENSSTIIEGVHIVPGRMQKKFPAANLFECFLYVEDEKKHRQHFTQRAQHAPARKLQGYLDNFREIRWIQDYLHRKAEENGIVQANNMSSVEGVLGKVLEQYSLWNSKET